MAVVGAGVVGSAVALELARRGVAVALLEALTEPGLCASGTNSGILHTGFDSQPGELETDLILASAPARDELVKRLGIPVLRCGAILRADPERLAAVTAGARRNGVSVRQRDERTLEIPGEAITDPATYTLALAREAERQGAHVRMGFALAAIDSDMALRAGGGESLRCRMLVNCAGLFADDVARMLGDDSFSIYPRKGEFLVFEGPKLDQILLPVPSERTKGVLVFPTVDGKVIAGPTAVDLEDKRDWSVRPQARTEILTKAAQMLPGLEGMEPIASYAGLRPAGRGVNYVIGRARACQQLINVAAIRSTGLTASAGIALKVAELVGVSVAPRRELIGGQPPQLDMPWWMRAGA
jgi:glycerol-3-phosphate dehydrogenase